jgi:hypothetical protein
MGEQLMTIMLNGSDLTVTQVAAAAAGHGETVALAGPAGHQGALTPAA